MIKNNYLLDLNTDRELLAEIGVPLQFVDYMNTRMSGSRKNER